MNHTTTTTAYDYDVVLIGCGHAHVHVLKMLGHMIHNTKNKNNNNHSNRRRRHRGSYNRTTTTNVQYTMISSHISTPYSGMLPGYIAGHYPNKEQIHLNVIQLCRYANVRFIHASVNHITYQRDDKNKGGGYVYMTTTARAANGDSNHQDQCHHPPIRYDCLSINIGCVPIPLYKTPKIVYDNGITTSNTNDQQQQQQQQKLLSSKDYTNNKVETTTSTSVHNTNGDSNNTSNNTNNTSSTVTNTMIIPVKPIADLCHYWDTIIIEFQQYLQQYQQQQQHKMDDTVITNSNTNFKNNDPYTIAIVGGGMGGIELALSIQYKLQQLCSNSNTINNTNTNNTNNNTIVQNESNNVVVYFHVVLITRGSMILESIRSKTNCRVRQKLLRILKERNIQIIYNANVNDVRLYSNSNNNSNNNNDPYSNNSKQQQSSSTTTTTTPSFVRKKKEIVFTTTTSKETNPSSSSSTIVPNPILVVDVCLSCITGSAPKWLSTNTPFTTTGIENGNYIRVHPTYECISHHGIFATGDCCTIDLYPRPKAGVYAVRAGPILYQNILRYIHQSKLIYHYPQSTYLSIVSTGDQYAIATKGKYFCIEGKYLWHIKDYIDRKWMSKYSTDIPDLQDIMIQKQFRPSIWNIIQGKSSNTLYKEHCRINNESSRLLQEQQQQHSLMRCGGCGAKVGATIVSRVLRQIYDRQIQRATAYNLSFPNPIDHDDTAVTVLPATNNSSNSDGGNGGTLIQTIDYFRSMITDPYIFGKIVAVHALSDIHAMGVVSNNSNTIQLSALVLAVVPYATKDSITESTLFHLLCGVSDVLQDENVQFVGGHTCEGIELACGLSITGYIPPTINFDDTTITNTYRLWRKRGGKVGDHIIITKPIGTGALFAAEMRAVAQGEHVEEAIQCMLQSNYTTSCMAREFCNIHGDDVVHACTDVTGFGLIGHLLEMLFANDTGPIGVGTSLDRISAVLYLQSIPYYRGGIDAANKGIYSSLQPQNERNQRAITNQYDVQRQLLDDEIMEKYKLLFDPQTAGGLMFFVDPKYSKEFTSYLLNVGKIYHTSMIGTIEQYNDAIESVETLLKSTDLPPDGNSSSALLLEGDLPQTTRSKGPSTYENRIRIQRN